MYKFMIKLAILVAVMFFYSTRAEAQVYEQEQNQLVLYHNKQHNKIEIILIGHRVKLKLDSNGETANKKVKIKAIQDKYIVSELNDTILLSQISDLKNISLGADNKREGWVVLAIGVGLAGATYGLGTVSKNNSLGSLAGLVTGFSSIVAGTYGAVNLIIGAIKTNRWFDLREDWKPTVEVRKFYPEGNEDTVE